MNVFYLRAAIFPETLLVKWIRGINMKVTFCDNTSLNRHAYHVITHMVIVVMDLLANFSS